MSVIWMYTILGVCLIGAEKIQGAPSKSSPVSESVAQFSIELFKQIVVRSEKNVLISPLSVWEACLSAYYGAGGSTERELRKLLRIEDGKKEEIAASVKKFNEDLRSLKSKKFNFTLANRVYIDKTLSEPAKKQTFLTPKELIKMDLTKNPQDDINKWVDAVTNGKIKSIIPGPLSASDRMVIVNAVYMKGRWRNAFEPSETSEGKFHTSAEKTVKVQFMHLDEPFHRATSADLKADVLKMPYVAKGVSMYVFLPKDKHGSVKKMVEKMSPSFISALDFKRKASDVRFPKFKIEQLTDLVKPLTQLGSQEMFSSADFSGFTANKGLHVSQVKQKSFIEVDEQGTEAAAATVMVVADSAPSESTPFHCDHPFMFVIHDDTNKVPLFMGIVTDPSIPPA